jgi:hypothetical protein
LRERSRWGSCVASAGPASKCDDRPSDRARATERDDRSAFTYEAILIEMGEEPLTGM